MILRADARAIPLADESVQCVITSPPYWGLRDYGVDGQIGLERTPEEYVTTIVAVFGEVHRILKPNGTVWLNLGDSYGSGTRTSRAPSGSDVKHSYWTNPAIDKRIPSPAKQLLGMPWRIALALQTDGWWLRKDIVWWKTNPMPESVRDRPTSAHEYLFLLAKSGAYYYDANAIREPPQVTTNRRSPGTWDGGFPPRAPYVISSTRRKESACGAGIKSNSSFNAAVSQYHVPSRNRRDVWMIASEPNRWGTCRGCGYTSERWPKCALCAGKNCDCVICHGKRICPNCSSADVTGHFATFPQKLVEPCVLAGSRRGDIVFDPFLGSGTVGKVAAMLGRRWAGLELSPNYIAIARARVAQPPKPTRRKKSVRAAGATSHPHIVALAADHSAREALTSAAHSRSSRSPISAANTTSPQMTLFNEPSNAP